MPFCSVLSEKMPPGTHRRREAEQLKARLSVETSDHAARRQRRIVDACRAKRQRGQHAARQRPIPRKQIQRRRFCTPPQRSDDTIDAVKGVYRQNGAEDLLAVQHRAGGDALHQRQRDAAAFLADIAAEEDPAVGEMPLQPLEMHAVDDLRILWIFAGRCRIKPVVRLADAGEKLRFDAAFDEKIVRRGTGLPGGEQLGRDDPARGEAEIGARIHDAGGFPADIRYDGRELCRRCPADDARRRTRNFL